MDVIKSKVSQINGPQSIKLRDLIRNVRACKTAAEERAVITKECALCRTQIKDQSAASKHRHRNVAKLLFMHMLGYPTHFAQMEALKLVASQDQVESDLRRPTTSILVSDTIINCILQLSWDGAYASCAIRQDLHFQPAQSRFSDKRLGYLALMILLDENTQVLMLVTNSLKNDFSHKNPYVVGLALNALGNISSTDMARDLSAEIEKFFRSSNAYLRKKAALCATRIIRKVPDCIDDFLNPVMSLMNDQNHAVLLTAISLVIEMVKIKPSHKKKFRKLVPTLVRLLKNLVVAGYVSEYDVVGITDPFLQAKIIHLLRLLGAGDSKASDAMNDILAQVAINTEATKNPGNAILYECVQTIMSIEAEGGLRVLAVNILGRFLLNRDNNIRYVALNTLCKVVGRDSQAIQRHRNTVVDCLKDADVSIRKRALDLIYALVTPNNVEALVKELLNYLAITTGDNEFKTDLTDKICTVADRLAPNRRWHIDSVTSVLETAGNLTKDTVASDLVSLISRSGSLHAYSTHKLYNVLKNADDATLQRPLAYVGVWCIGEYGDLLVSDEGAQKASIDGQSFQAPSETDVLKLLHKLSRNISTDVVTKEYILSALVKLSDRFTSSRDTIAKMLSKFKHSSQLELQQRSIEYGALVGASLDSVRKGVLAQMPTAQKRKTIMKDSTQAEENGEDHEDDDDESEEESSSSDDDESDEDSEEEEKKSKKKAAKVKPEPSSTGTKASGGSASLFDLDDIFSAQAASPGALAAAAPTPAPTGSMDILSGLFDGPAAPAATPSPATAIGGGMDFMDMFAGGSGGAANTPAAPQFPPQTVWQGSGIAVTFHYERDDANPRVLTVTAKFTTSQANVTGFDFQVAVPKYLKLTMKPPSSTSIVVGGAPVSQVILIDNTMHGQKKVLVRVKINFTINGQSHSETAQISNFPA